MYVADYQTTAADGDLELAREYLERLAASNAEEVSQATELLKKVKDMIVKTHDGAEAQTKVTVGESAGPSQPTVENTGPESGNGPAMTTGWRWFSYVHLVYFLLFSFFLLSWGTAYGFVYV